jgi:hypothetical protein
MKNLKPKMKDGYALYPKKFFSKQHLLLICCAILLVNVTFAKGRITETILNKTDSSISSPAITSTATISGSLHTSFSFAIKASNSPTNFTATTLPTGLTINSSTGIISGTPTVSGSYTILLTVSNQAGAAKQTIVITIN